MGGKYVGIEIGGTKLQIVTGDAFGKIIQRWRYNVDVSLGGKGIRQQIERTIEEISGQGQPISGVGIGFGGPVNTKTGIIECSHQVGGWSGFPLKTWLQENTPAPVQADNDANVASLGETHYGAGRGCNPVFYVTMGSGVGGGLTVGGKIYHGAIPGEAEIGHVRLDRTGATVESRCSGWAVDKKIREAIIHHPESLISQLAKGQNSGEARFLAEACKQQDPVACQILRETAEDLAFALSHVTHLFHPQVIVLGGGLALVGEPLRFAIAEELPQFVMKAFHPAPEIHLASLGEDAVPIGALKLAQTAMR
jgi:glucokinase